MIEFDEGSVQETLLESISARYNILKKYPSLDVKFDFNIYDKIYPYLTKNKSNEKYLKANTEGDCFWISVTVRTKAIDSIIFNILKDYSSNLNIINLGCGLDDIQSRFNRFNNICYYNIDYENVILLREKILEKRIKNANLISDIMDFSWIDNIIDNQSKTIIVLSGVSMYLKNEEILNLIKHIFESFKDVHIIFDSFSNFMKKSSNFAFKHLYKKKEAFVQSSISKNSLRSLKEIKVLQFENMYNYIPNKTFKEMGLLTKIKTKLVKSINLANIIHITK